MSKRDFTSEDDSLLQGLGIEVEAKKSVEYTAREERIVSGFEEILRFVQKYNREPTISENADIFERTYAVRLSKIRDLKESKALLSGIDTLDLLKSSNTNHIELNEQIDDDTLLKELGVEPSSIDSITKLEHVKPRAKINSADKVASRKKSNDFEQFKPVFAKIRDDIRLGKRGTLKFKDDIKIMKGDSFILDGQIAYIASKGIEFRNKNNDIDSEIRVIFDNGTETPDLLMRSFQRAMHKDENSRRVGSNDNTQLFSDDVDLSDRESGTIYVLRSNSDYPLVAENRDVIHKIGVTGGDVKKRIANAKHDPTYLMANVEVVSTYHLANINRVKLEKLIHKFFGSSLLEIKINDRFGKIVTANEWFMVPIFIIDEMIEKIKDGSLSNYFYDKDAVEIKEL